MDYYVRREEIYFSMTYSVSTASALGNDRLLSVPLADDVSNGVWCNHCWIHIM